MLTRLQKLSVRYFRKRQFVTEKHDKITEEPTLILRFPSQLWLSFVTSIGQNFIEQIDMLLYERRKACRVSGTRRKTQT